ncbi:MAG: 5-formyltetrahydrofolate cyclo-ligase [Alphaproteobacteria bacterium]|nr:5-formyltetrahydrofolate cyclo-ligase [Alphaproteobacteria bacterium]
MNPVAGKRGLRELARSKRRAAAESGSEAGERLRESFLSALPLPPAQVVAGYWPLPEEIDVRPLMTNLHLSGQVLVLPVVVGRGQPLIFRRWRPSLPLDAGVYGISVPSAEAPEATPGVLLVPLLAFDGEGRRLGYGAGYYDRTLATLRRAGDILAIGAAYAAQRMDSLPEGASDQRLDWVVTEEGAIRTGRVAA